MTIKIFRVLMKEKHEIDDLLMLGTSFYNVESCKKRSDGYVLELTKLPKEQHPSITILDSKISIA